MLFLTYLLTSGEEGQGGPGMEARLASQPSQASLWGQGAVPGMGEGIQLQRQGLHVTTVSSQMASSARVLSFTRCHFLWRQGRGDGAPTKGWLHKPSLLRAREILRVGRVGSGFCQTIPTEAKTRTAAVRSTHLFISCQAGAEDHLRDSARLGTPGQHLFSPSPAHPSDSLYPTFYQLCRTLLPSWV